MDTRMSITLAKRQLVDSIWKSAGIEGLGTTFSNTESIIYNRIVTTRRDEVLFIINMEKAWKYLIENVDYDNSIMILSQFNKICGDNIFYGAGELRKIPVSIGGTTWKPTLPHRAEIIEDMEKIIKIEDKCLCAIKMFCFICRKQMFIDGNKRVAQLMCNKILMQYDIGILSIPYDEIAEFKEKLVDYYETSDDEKMIQFLKEKCIMYAYPK